MSNLGNFGIPNPALPIGTAPPDKNGDPVPVRLNDAWHTFLVRLSQLSAESSFAPQTPGPSPWSYVATTIGDLYVRNGTISAMTINRGAVTVTLTPQTGFIPMAAGDIVTITYTVAPTVTFLPRARA